MATSTIPKTLDTKEVNNFYFSLIGDLGTISSDISVIDTSVTTLSTFTQSGAGSVSRTPQNKMRDTVSVLDKGAVGDGSTDDSSAIQTALDNHYHVVVPEGVYSCFSMLELDTDTVLELQGGAILKRFSATSASTDPVIWIKGARSALRGAGQASSQIVTQNRSPNGVVLIGHASMAASHGNVTYNTIRGLRISGSTGYGQTTGDPDVALLIQNPQLSGYAVYFQDISGLMLDSANYGIWLRGWANGNTINNIQGYQVGNATLGANKNAFIYCLGGLDNTVSNAFLHDSPDSIGLLVDAVDNSSNGGSVHTPFANSFRGMVFEQGGATAYGVKALSGSGCFYEVRDNCALGNSLFANFESSNLLIGINSYTNTLGQNANIRYNRSLTNERLGYETYATHSPLTENTTYKIADIPIHAYSGALVEIEFLSTSGGGLEYQGAGKVVYEFKRSSGGTVTGSAILSRYTGLVKPCVPIISGGTGVIVFFVNDNATATSNFGLTFNMKIVTTDYNTAPTIFTAAEVYGTPGTPLAATI